MAVNPQSLSLPFEVTRAVESTLQEWTTEDTVRRIWNRDASLWTGSNEDRWLGWLDIVPSQLERRNAFLQIAEDVRAEGFTEALLLGMGGSSLCPEVLRLTFENDPSFPALHVLDSTDPAQIRATESSVELERTLFIVSSKSGTTLESSLLFEYFFDRVAKILSPVEAGRRFVAITDPGSRLESLANQRHLRSVFAGQADVGGRFSALSDFGMVPAAVMGLDVARLLAATDEMVSGCGPDVSTLENPGVLLGIALGRLAGAGRDKMTIVTSRKIAGLGAWLEQLVAESTGQDGKGIVPVDGETLGSPEVYGADRVFVYLKLSSDENSAEDAAIGPLEEAGQPVVRIELEDVYSIGQEFFRWEMATAVAGSLLRLNPFVQPDVDASKVAARRVTSEFEESGELAGAVPIFEAAGIKLFSSADTGPVLGPVRTTTEPSLARHLGSHLGTLAEGDYFCIQAYVEMSRDHEAVLSQMRDLVRDRKHVATCLGFGPRFLHSTGQLHKGGPPTGVFLQITCDDGTDLPVPGRSYSFGVVKAAQASGDMTVLSERGRRVLRAHIEGNLTEGLDRLREAIAEAFES